VTDHYRIDARSTETGEQREIPDKTEKNRDGSGALAAPAGAVVDRESRQVPVSPHGDLGLVTGRFCWMLVHDGPDAIIYTDIGGLIRFWNAAAERLFGYSPREAIGRPLGVVMPGMRCERYWETCADGRRGSPDWNSGLVSAAVRHKDGTRIAIEFAMFRDLDRSGTLVGVAVIARDVTQRLQNRMASGTGDPSRAVQPGAMPA
jgi:PAS domain S-box-containing protein